MKQVFFNPFGNSYTNTISNTISKEFLFDMLEEKDVNNLRKVSKNKVTFSIWGTTIKSTWSKMNEKDLIIYVQKKHAVFYAEILYTCISKELSSNLWGDSRDWRYIYILSNVKEISTPVENIKNFAGYNNRYTFRGLSRLHSMRTDKFLDEFYFDIFINNRIERSIK